MEKMENKVTKKKIGNKFYYVDKNYNRWDVERYGKKEAQHASFTLTDCYNCTNCFDCRNCFHSDNLMQAINCFGCQNLISCRNMNYCYNCTDCAGCTACSDCIQCYRCMNCNNCETCHKSIFLDDCYLVENLEFKQKVYKKPKDY